ncbi:MULTISPECIES: CDP-glycerol glycerophosphotransferase family protein [Enterobacterales]|uniref:CDP-glycerol glycerophosphotransferase family protein n=1 Tax=Enterobacterales TaxID=91347 RepID=UPI002ED8ADDB
MNNYPVVDHRLFQALSQISIKKTKCKKRILFFDRDAFSDNTKYLYLHMVKNTQLECIWCTWNEDVYTMLQQHNLPVHLIGRNNDETINLFLETHIAVFCVNPHHSLHRNWLYFACLEGAIHIQLWHGISVKKLLLQLTPYLSTSDPGFSTSLAWASRADYVLSTAIPLNTFWSEVFGCHTIFNTGYPRNEVLVRPAKPSELLGAKLNGKTTRAILNKRRKIFIAPTWQRFKNTELLSKDIVSKLIIYTQKNNIDVFIKAHAYHHTGINIGSLEINNFYFIDMNTDMYPYMSKFDILITDYSSIMFDYLLTNKPIMTLDILSGTHENFEPDYNLVPVNDDFRYKFNSENIITVLHQALNRDERSLNRTDAKKTLFQSDAASSSHTLSQFINTLTE